MLERLLECKSDSEFLGVLHNNARALRYRARSANRTVEVVQEDAEPLVAFCSGIRRDLARRLEFYVSDFTDGLRDRRAVHKVLATTFFLYFLCILSSVALGVLNSKNTNGKIGTPCMLMTLCRKGEF